MSEPISPVAAAAVDLDGLLAQRGRVTPADLGLTPDGLLELARARPELEPIFLVRFRNRYSKVRVEEVRAYGWPSRQLAMRHLGYLAEDRRLLRLEPRQPVPFPARQYATFLADPVKLEELRKLEKLYQAALKQAASKPGRAEMALAPLESAFRTLDPALALEMWIDAAAAFQRLDNSTYASKMLGRLLQLVAKDAKVDCSLLARTVLAAADDGVFNTKLYEHTWELLRKKVSVQSALGFGLRVFRRLMASGRALPTDFVKDLRRGALAGQVRDFDGLFDAHLLWAAGLPSFWNTARKTSSWRSAATEDHKETAQLRQRLAALWQQARAAGEPGAAWTDQLWARLLAVAPELSTYGRTVLLETLLQAAAAERADAERLLEAGLLALSRPPRDEDRARVEITAQQALDRVLAQAGDLFWEKSASLDQALRTSIGNLDGFVVLYDLLGDVSERLPPRAEPEAGPGGTLLDALPGLRPAWAAALAHALRSYAPEEPAPAAAAGPAEPADGEEGEDGEGAGEEAEGEAPDAEATGEDAEGEDAEEDEEEDDEDDSGSSLPLVPLLGEALSLFPAAQAPELLAELGPRLGEKLAADLAGDDNLDAWSRVLTSLLGLGVVGQAVVAQATRSFLERTEGSAAIGHAARLAHLLDQEPLRLAAETHGLLDEALECVQGQVAPPAAAIHRFGPPEAELGEKPSLAGCVAAPDGQSCYLLWREETEDWKRTQRKVALTRVGLDGTLTLLATSKVDEGGNLALQLGEPGVRILLWHNRVLTLYNEKLKSIKKIDLTETLPEGWGQEQVRAGRQHVLVTYKDQAVLLDRDLQAQGEYVGTGRWGDWYLLEGAPGATPVVFQRHYNQFAVFPAPGSRNVWKEPKEFRSLQLALRTASGWSIEFINKKDIRRRLRYDEAAKAWNVEDGPLAEPVLDWVSLSGSDPIPLRNHGTVGYVERSDEIVHDWQGQPLAFLAQHEGPCQALDLATGIAFYGDAVVHDPSLPARLAAAPLLRQAAGGPAAGALARSLLLDEAARAAELQARLASRPTGAEALALLGPHAAPLWLAVSRELQERLTARARLLDALAAPPPPPASVPVHVPGVPRTELRRLTREEFSSDLGGLLFWALDGEDPQPVVDHLFVADQPVPHAAWVTALRLLRLAQEPATSARLAVRLLAIAEVLAGELATPGRLFELEGHPTSTARNREGLRIAEDTNHLLWPRYGSIGKKAAPLEFSKDPAMLRAAVRQWVEGTLLSPLRPTMIEQLEDDNRASLLDGDWGPVRRYRAEVAEAGAVFSVFVAAQRREKGLEWWLDGLTGRATTEQWAAICRRVEQVGVELGCLCDRPIELARGGISREDQAALQQGIALTRASLAQREQFQPEFWPPPEVRGLSEPRDRRLVLLAWLLDTIETEQVGSTRPVFERVAKATRAVRANWRGLQPVFGGRQDDEEGDPAGSLDFARFRARALVQLTRGRHQKMQRLVVLVPPADLGQAVQREIAAIHGKGGQP